VFCSINIKREIKKMESSSSSIPPTAIASSLPVSNITTSLNSWTQQTLERIHLLFYSHSDVPITSSESMYFNLKTQFEKDSRVDMMAISGFFLMNALWGLVRLEDTENLESRRQYGLFINHLQHAENCLLKAIQTSQK
jgi:hypothetical protein